MNTTPTSNKSTTEKTLIICFAVSPKFSPTISETDANALADFIHQFDHVVNLIPYNEVEGVEHTRPSVKKIDKFYNYLKNVRRVNVTLRQEKGSDIDGACGQLRQRNKKGDN